MRYNNAVRLIQILTLVIVFLTIPYTLQPIRLYAFTMKGGNYRIELPDILGEQIEVKAPPQVFLKENPTIKKEAGPFVFTVSSNIVDFGIMTATDPVTRTINLIVEKGQTPGYQVFASQNHPLTNPQTGEIIPDAPCDSGKCSQTNAQSWINPLAFGMGYRVDNVQGSTSALDLDGRTSLFLQFSDTEASESARIILSSRNLDVKKNDEARITYKVNIPASQGSGVYQNIIYYVAIPNF